MPNQRHYIALILTAVIICPMMTMLYFPIKEKYIQHRALERMENESLETLSIAPQDLIWVKAGKEIVFKNDLYDVKKIVKVGDSLLVTVLKDTEEMKLHAIRNKMDSSKTGESLLLQKQAAQLVWINYQTIDEVDLYATLLAKPKLINYTSRLEDGSTRPCFSPPWIG